MKRRLFLGGALALTATECLAAGDCAPPGFLAPNSLAACNAHCDLRKIQVAAQKESEWCWAASISMMFANAGYEVPQQGIVARGFGRPVNSRGSIQEILAFLNSDWQDIHGQNFTSKITSIYSADADVKTISNPQIIEALVANKSIFYCTKEHAMVLFQVNYQPPSAVHAAVVVDPMPGIGIRQLAPAELVPVTQGGFARLIATVAVAPENREISGCI